MDQYDHYDNINLRFPFIFLPALYGKKITDFTYNDQAMGLVMKESVAQLSFVGSLGLTQFDENGDPKSIFDVRYQIGNYHFYSYLIYNIVFTVYFYTIPEIHVHNYREWRKLEMYDNIFMVQS